MWSLVALVYFVSTILTTISIAFGMPDYSMEMRVKSTHASVSQVALEVLQAALQRLLPCATINAWYLPQFTQHVAMLSPFIQTENLTKFRPTGVITCPFNLGYIVTYGL